ncbi:MAG: hypothetical protein Greene071436_51 [Parcubacteria group bacterium Greene0714_36]|nr:MAG: hypothetical protein Greene071436_51 [Parcubacteria group bacterium Greene0714_36]
MLAHFGASVSRAQNVFIHILHPASGNILHPAALHAHEVMMIFGVSALVVRMIVAHINLPDNAAARGIKKAPLYSKTVGQGFEPR